MNRRKIYQRVLDGANTRALAELEHRGLPASDLSNLRQGIHSKAIKTFNAYVFGNRRGALEELGDLTSVLHRKGPAGFSHGLKKVATMGMASAQRGMTGLRSAAGAMAAPKVKMPQPAALQASSGLAGARVQMDAGTVARAGG